MGRVVALALAMFVIAGCTSAPVAPSPTEPAAPVTRAEPAPRATAAPTPTATPAPTPGGGGPRLESEANVPLPRVFIVVMENTGLARALRTKTMGGLASRHTLMTSYHGVARPSLPNYLAMTSGSTWNITDNAYRALPATGIGTQLTEAGISWRAYMEGMTNAGCMRSPYPYALKHNPFAYYGGGCPANVVPYEALDADLDGTAPSFLFIKPDMCHDGHDCSLDVAGAWLEGAVARITGSRAWDDRSVLFIAWDEGDGGDPTNLAPLIVVAKNGTPREIATQYDHYSLLATIEDLFKLPRLGAAKDARSMAELLAIGN